jgi:acetyl-CoA C-acetyltransferase
MGTPVFLPLQAGIGIGPWPKSIKDRYGVEQFSQFTGAEMMAQIYGFSREELDQFALSSHRKAAAAADSGAFEREVVVVHGVDREGNARRHDLDEGIRADVSLEGLAGLNPIAADGMITAGNASQVCDGASGVLVVSERALRSHGLTPIARIENLTVTAGDPVIMLEEPIPATRRALERSGRRLDEIDLYEVNEAFAPVPLAWLKEIGADRTAQRQWRCDRARPSACQRPS